MGLHPLVATTLRLFYFFYVYFHVLIETLGFTYDARTGILAWLGQQSVIWLVLFFQLLSRIGKFKFRILKNKTAGTAC